MNIISIVGRLGQNPELKIKGDTEYCKFSVATRRRFKSPNGEYETDWHDVVCFGKTAAFADKYLKKGSMVAIFGEYRSNTYVRDDGTKAKSWTISADNIEFASSKSDNDTPADVEKSTGSTKKNTWTLKDDDDDLPF